MLITYSITQQDSFEMALAYLDAISSYSKSLTVSSNELVIMLLGNKLDLERTRSVHSFEAKIRCVFCSSELFQSRKANPWQRSSVAPFAKPPLPMTTNMFSSYFIELFGK